MKFYRVSFNVKYSAIVGVRDGEFVDDVISDIDVPENDTCTYIQNSFDVDQSSIVEDKTLKQV